MFDTRFTPFYGLRSISTPLTPSGKMHFSSPSVISTTSSAETPLGGTTVLSHAKSRFQGLFSKKDKTPKTPEQLKAEAEAKADKEIKERIEMEQWLEYCDKQMREEKLVLDPRE